MIPDSLAAGIVIQALDMTSARESVDEVRKKGHLASVCRSKPHKSTPATQTKYVEDGSDSNAETPVLTLSGSRTPLIRVCVNLAGQVVMMEVDTGAAVSLMSAKQWFGLQLSHQMEPSNCSLRTYTGEAIATKGKVNVEVTHMKQR